ncbi:hypothetical protein CAL28_08330 [Bordetella genomosp. 11]|uniref:Uncharacterized protein n=1 Tax=Bordetella genomosp. 11 TaxID=1416808 RepID=A0A261UE69_9BORD|nr:hypothetical protein CAL28_08330 [Bordetella genomosp. 11]
MLCHHVDEGCIAFELVRLIDQDIAVAMTGRRGQVVVFSTEDPTARIIRSKLNKHYRTAYPVELLVCWEPAIITPDDVIVITLRSVCAQAPSHPFRRIWYAGEHACWYVWGPGDDMVRVP